MKQRLIEKARLRHRTEIHQSHVPLLIIALSFFCAAVILVALQPGSPDPTRDRLAAPMTSLTAEDDTATRGEFTLHPVTGQPPSD